MNLGLLATIIVIFGPIAFGVFDMLACEKRERARRIMEDAKRGHLPTYDHSADLAAVAVAAHGLRCPSWDFEVRSRGAAYQRSVNSHVAEVFDAVSGKVVHRFNDFRPDVLERCARELILRLEGKPYGIDATRMRSAA